MVVLVLPRFLKTAHQERCHRGKIQEFGGITSFTFGLKFWDFVLFSCGSLSSHHFWNSRSERTPQAGSTLTGSKVLSCVVCWHRGIPLLTGGIGWRLQALMQWAAAYDMPVAIAVVAKWSAYVARPKTQGLIRMQTQVLHNELLVARMLSPTHESLSTGMQIH